MPDVVVTHVTADCEFVILGCDGVWDVTSDSEVPLHFFMMFCIKNREFFSFHANLRFVQAAKMLCDAPTNDDIGKAARQIVRSSFERLSDDNTTVVAVRFEQCGEKNGGDE